MNRRRYLSLFGAASLSTVAGCLGDDDEDDEPENDDGPADENDHDSPNEQVTGQLETRSIDALDPILTQSEKSGLSDIFEIEERDVNLISLSNMSAPTAPENIHIFADIQGEHSGSILRAKRVTPYANPIRMSSGSFQVEVSDNIDSYDLDVYSLSGIFEKQGAPPFEATGMGATILPPVATNETLIWKIEHEGSIEISGASRDFNRGSVNYSLYDNSEAGSEEFVDNVPSTAANHLFIRTTSAWELEVEVA